MEEKDIVADMSAWNEDRVVRKLICVLSFVCGLAPAANALAAPQAKEGPAQAALNLPGPELEQTLKLSITEAGPYQTWEATVTNRSSATVSVPKDPRLLWFRVDVPGQRRTKECQLPQSMWPSRDRTHRIVKLAPKERFRFRFDPRFYCFSNAEQSLLVAGAYIEPHYGWPARHTTQWRRGKAERIRSSKQNAPFLIEGLHEDGAKELVGMGFALDSRYQAWAKTRLGSERKGSRKLQLALTRGTDTQNASDATVDVTLTSNAPQPKQVYWRRERLTFSVSGPDGTFECRLSDGVRAPDPQGYTTLSPGKSVRLSVRLYEFCPREALARPGYYLVSATFDHAPGARDETTSSDEEVQVVSRRARLVRIRQGALPYRARPPVNPDEESHHAPPGPPPVAF